MPISEPQVGRCSPRSGERSAQRDGLWLQIGVGPQLHLPEHFSASRFCSYKEAFPLQTPSAGSLMDDRGVQDTAPASWDSFSAQEALSTHVAPFTLAMVVGFERPLEVSSYASSALYTLL